MNAYIIELGNGSPKQGLRTVNPDGTEATEFTELPGPAVTRVVIPVAETIDPETGAGVDGYTITEALKIVTDPQGVWVNHSAGDPPTWVHSNHEVLEWLFANQYGSIQGKPANVEETHYTLQGPPGAGENYLLREDAQFADPTPTPQSPEVAEAEANAAAAAQPPATEDLPTVEQATGSATQAPSTTDQAPATESIDPRVIPQPPADQPPQDQPPAQPS